MNLDKLKNWLRILTGVSRLDPEFSAQLARPSGKLAKNVGNLMYDQNREVVDLVLEEVEFDSGMYVLDIGVGPGYSLEKLSRNIRSNVEFTGKIVGVDPSTEMLEMARDRLVREIEQKHVELIQAETPKLPFAEDSMDYVLATNVIYFWEDLAVHFDDLVRVIKPGGKLVIYMTASESLRGLVGNSPHFHLRDEADVQSELEITGFMDVEIKPHYTKAGFHGFIFTAKSPE